MADEVKLALIVVEAEKQRSDLAAVLVLSIATHDTVGGPAVLQFDHRSLAVDVRQVELLGDDPVTACRLELVEPGLGLFLIGGRGGEIPEVAQIGSEILEHRTPFGEGSSPEIFAADGEKIERDKLRWGLAG